MVKSGLIQGPDWEGERERERINYKVMALQECQHKIAMKLVNPEIIDRKINALSITQVGMHKLIQI